MICVGNLLIPDHDAGVFLVYKDPIASKPLDKIAEVALGGLICWDGQHFLQIALHGYQREPSTAFFPLFPLFVRELHNYIFPDEMEIYISPQWSLAIIGIVLNFFLFVLSALAMFCLTFYIFQDLNFAVTAGEYQAVVLWHPSSNLACFKTHTGKRFLPGSSAQMIWQTICALYWRTARCPSVRIGI
ncbi:unnamed protein product [Darwinula stevensoni]|uniref:GPI mannosyltransferase 2 n=1 Tax=Darwinula stevensoni TaxID=69355 RepID=A0A7R8XE45_9CRUS|nr:unnamed protein product [Darwinula stevensoni]CAG0895447.1 unnamed protein product [Darwinula stevensoni]